MRKAIGLVAFVLLSVPAVAEPFHHPFGEWREYNRDWLAACPDVINEDATDFYGYSCFARTGSQELNGANLPAYKLTLIRNRLNGALDLAITSLVLGLTRIDGGDAQEIEYHARAARAVVDVFLRGVEERKA